MTLNCGHYSTCFLHFFDIHFLDEYRGNPGIDSELLLATKFAFLCSTSLVIPMSSYFENQVCRSIIDNIKKDVPSYDIFFMGNSSSVEEFAATKLCQYDPASTKYKIYEKVLNDGIGDDILIRRKRTDTTGAIKQDWKRGVNDESLFLNFVSVEGLLPNDFYDKCTEMHSLLGGLAYTPEHINKILFGDVEPHSPLGRQVRSFINKSYFSSYLDVLSPCAVVTELRILYSDYVDTDKYHLHIPYLHILNHLSTVNILKKITNNSFAAIYKMKTEDKLMAEIARAIERYFSARRQLGTLNQTFVNYGEVGVMATSVNNAGNIAGSQNIPKG